MKKKYKLDEAVYYTKLRKLQIKCLFLVVLEIVGITICTMFVFMSTYGFSKDSTHIRNISFSQLGLIVFLVSIIMALANSGNVRKKINIIKSYLNALENNSSDGVKSKYKIKADQLISSLDIYEEKLKRGEQIRLHDKRDVIRNYMICFGIFLMVSVAIIILFIFDLNFPILMAWEAFIVYFLVMLEFFIYQLIVNKSGFNVFSEKHKNCISTGKVNRIEDMKYIQSIFKVYSKYIVYAL